MASKKKILIVEDDDQIRQIYEMKLGSAGYSVQVAIDGVQGLELAEAFQPHLILLDLRMPNLSGDQMLEKLRNTEWGKNIKVVVLTNVSRNEASLALRHLGIEAYLVKANYLPSQILQVIEDVLSR